MRNSVIIALIIILIGLVAVLVYVYRQPTGSLKTVNSPTPSTRTVVPTVTSGEQKSIESGLNLQVTQPSDGAIVTKSTITVSGKTTANAEIAVNDLNLKADGQGNFSTTLMLDEGENIIAVVANDSAGNYAEKQLTVTYNPPSTQ